MGIPKNGWFIMENPIKWMIWGYPHDLGSLHMCGIVEGVSFPVKLSYVFPVKLSAKSTNFL
jgi:hypothetical protein